MIISSTPSADYIYTKNSDLIRTKLKQEKIESYTHHESVDIMQQYELKGRSRRRSLVNCRKVDKHDVIILKLKQQRDSFHTRTHHTN